MRYRKDMDFIEGIRVLAKKIEEHREHIQTEEATKNAFIMPFIQSLGYSVFNTMEVCPEYTADYPGLKGKKVDYAILMEGKPTILIECKCCTETLENPKHSSQLHAYFHVTEAKFGILTNGIIYRFYTDIEKDNVMDEKPFFEFDLLDFTDASVDELKRFSKTGFNPDELGDAAKDLLYTKEIKRIMADQFTTPSEEFVKFFAKQVYSGKLTSTVVEKFTSLAKKSLDEFFKELIADKLEKVINPPVNPDPPPDPIIDPEPVSKIETTEEELQGYYIVKSILRDEVDLKEIQHKDTKSYFGINLYGMPSKTICRLKLYKDNPEKNCISILDDAKKEDTHSLNSLDDIYKLAPQLKARVKSLLEGKASKATDDDSADEEQE
jgi:hypothetical protein